MTPAHTSRLAAGWAADPLAPPGRALDGSAVLADLSGFTRLTERLTGTGVEGVEVLHQVLTRCFTTLLGPAIDLGGDVIAFAGDAALVWFDGADHVGRAVDAAAAMPRRLAQLPASVTGGRRLRASVGVHTGTFHAVLAGTAQRGLFLCGPETSLLALLEATAEPDQVVVSPTVAEHLGPSARGAHVGPGIVLRRSRRTGRDPLEPPPPPPSPEPGEVDLDSFVSPGVLELLEAGVDMGDHRTVSVGFVLVPGLDDLLATGGLRDVHDAIDGVVRTVTRVSRDLSVDWLDVDVGVNCVKLLLAAGAPRAVDHDEARLLLALRRILDQSDHRLRAGAQRGRLFAGPLGVATRRTYTLLGDPVNVAARALALAADGELVVGDGLGVDVRSSIVAAPLGTRVLKNRAEPMALWRVDAVGPPPVAPRSAAGSPTGLARHGEARRLAAAWKATVEGIGCSVAVVGEPGMGASELLAEVAALAGGTATVIAADPFRRHVPYAAITAIAADRAGDAGSGDAGAWLAGFVPRLPEQLRRWAPDALATLAQAAPSDRDPRTTALRTQLVLVALLRAAMSRPWLLAIDDVDAIDESSQQVIGRLRAATSDQPLMLVTSSTPGSTPFPDGFSDTITITLEPIPDTDAAALVAELAPSWRDDEIARVVAAAQGNPFVLAEMARGLPEDELPDSLHRLGATLVDTLSAQARALARDASIFGTVVPLTLAAEVLDRPELRSIGAWTGTEAVVRALDDDTLAFRHDVYRRVAYESLPFRRRRALHGAIADRIATDPEPNEALLALHHHEAGRVRDAYPLAVRAGQVAKATGALAEAVDLLRRAADMARDVDPGERARLLIDRGEALTWLGDLAGAARCYRAAGRVVDDPLVEGWLCHFQADLALTLNRYRRAGAWARRGLAVTAPLGDVATQVRCHLLLDLAARLDLSGRHRQSVPLAEQALTVATDAGVPLLQGLAHLHLEMAHSALMDPEAVSHGDAAVAIFEGLGHDRYLHHAVTNTGLTAVLLGRWDDAVDRYRRAVVHARASGQTLGGAIAELNLGYLLLRQGRLDQADTQARRALRTFTAIGVTQMVGYARLLRGQVAAADGRRDAAADHVAAARAAFVEVGDAAMVADCDVTTLDHLVAAGRYADAVRRADQLGPGLRAAETEVAITFDRVIGRAEVAMGAVGAGEGVARIERALAEARAHGLRYDVYLCLCALVAVTEDTGAVVPPDLRAERDAIAAGLGVVTPVRRR